MSMLDIWRSNRPSFLSSGFDSFDREFERISREMDRLASSRRILDYDASCDFSPLCDVDESDQDFVVTMDVPGMKADDIHINVVGNSVRVSGERHQEKEKKEANHYRMERSYGKFNRSFSLPENVDPDQIEANYDSGVLSLKIPKSEEIKARKVQVKASKNGLLRKITGEGKKKSAQA